jgi:hypothetical protein
MLAGNSVWISWLWCLAMLTDCVGYAGWFSVLAVQAGRIYRLSFFAVYSGYAG